MYLILAALALVTYFLWILLDGRNQPPGPWGLPLVGYLPFIDPAKPYETMTKLAQRYGPIFRLSMGQVNAVVLSDPGLIRDALKREEFTGRAPLFITHGIMGGHGIICAEGNLWRDQRRLSIEWLRKMGITKYGPARVTLERRILDGVNELVQDIKRESEKVFAVDLAPLMHHILGNLMNDLVFGQKYDRDDETWQYLQHLQEEGVKHIGVSMAVNFLPFLRHLPSSKRIIEFLLNGKAKTHKIYDSIIEKRRRALLAAQSQPLIGVNEPLGSEAIEADQPPDCILSNFVQETRRREANGRPELAFCSDTQLRHLLADLFGAGVDTTYGTLRWLLLFVARDLEVQRKLRQELRQAAQTTSRTTEGHRQDTLAPPGLDELDMLPYLKACVAETQRLRTVVPLGIPHGTFSESKLAGYRIPANTMIMPLLWAVHMDPKLWEADRFGDPSLFNPERFLDASSGQFVVPAHFMPFQTGKRMCLGDELARNILYLYAIGIFWNFELELFNGDSIDWDGFCGITLTPPTFEVMVKVLPTAE
ncbi:cytochrome P450 306a1 isoform X2 [Uranotaenia lowii]|nr:cytochrome P450 306a1 isoform X2 [Uranotaenia lowii]XP_055597458.1 cytochrome P450 306a1 isoform X2 [Uranotaenia lowii]XP_055597465.1 cytochrome P450 306a1 isoform X2 [Uranotaenia lowii]